MKPKIRLYRSEHAWIADFGDDPFFLAALGTGEIPLPFTRNASPSVVMAAKSLSRFLSVSLKMDWLSFNWLVRVVNDKLALVSPGRKTGFSAATSAATPLYCVPAAAAKLAVDFARG